MKISTQQPEENGVLIEPVSSPGQAHAFSLAGWLYMQYINQSIYFIPDDASIKYYFTLITHIPSKTYIYILVTFLFDVFQAKTFNI